ncbi:MAG: tRNA uracil 4-sulfurtransferase ThiI [Oscillospiraceae bacterium]
MKEIILIKNGEIALKGLNRATFEDILIKNMKHRLYKLGRFNFKKAQSTIYVSPENEDTDLDEAVNIVSKIFGIAAFARAAVCKKDFETIKELSIDYLKEDLEDAKTFKVEAKRADKSFPMKSPQICAELGGYILDNFPNLSVDVHNPDITVYVEIRDFGAYIHKQQTKGAGGMPVGTGGKSSLLVSGGIDSPVAGYMMGKRGIEISAVHFVSPPYTSQRAKEKVITLLEKIAEYCGKIDFYVVPFTEIQEQIRDNCPEEFFTIIMRRFMMKISQQIAKNIGSKALITGESVGQVASQTLGAIACTDAVCEMPVFRPLIGMDKEEIVTIARRIDTFETSILPYEDCCTVFTPKHPRTNPRIADIEDAESRLDVETLIKNAMENIEVITIR